MKSCPIALALAHATVSLTLFINCNFASAAFTLYSYVNLDSNPDQGDKVFDIYLSSPSLGRDAQYLAPDGTQLGKSEVVSGLSAAELIARFFPRLPRG